MSDEFGGPVIVKTASEQLCWRIFRIVKIFRVPKLGKVSYKRVNELKYDEKEFMFIVGLD